MIFNAKYIMFSYSLFYKIEFHLGLLDSKDYASDVGGLELKNGRPMLCGTAGRLSVGAPRWGDPCGRPYTRSTVVGRPRGAPLFTRRSFSGGGGYFVWIILRVALSVAVSNL